MADDDPTGPGDALDGDALDGDALDGNEAVAPPWWRRRNVIVGAGAAILVLLAVIVALALGDDAEDEAEPAPQPTTTTAPAEEERPIAPLTGLPLDDLGALERAVLVAKIDNITLLDRPDQAGLDVADVVIEEPVEGTTRLVALFHSTGADRIGPIRSTRAVDPGIVWPFGNVPYLYSGGTSVLVEAIRESPAQTFDEGAMDQAGARVRDPNWRAPHNLFSVPERIWSVADRSEPPEPMFAFLDEDEPAGGEPATEIAVPDLNRARYTWDDDAGRWLREQLRQLEPGRSAVGHLPHLAESGEQVAPANVIVQRIAGLDQSSVVGEGDAWVFSDGTVRVGRWTRPTLEDRTRWVDEDGEEIRLRPGRTWIHLVTDGEPEFVDGGAPVESE